MPTDTPDPRYREKGSAAAAMSSYRGVALRQVVEDDMPFLFRLLTDPERCHLWLQSRTIYDEEAFREAWAQWTSDSMGAKFVVERRGCPVGLAFEYDRSLEDGHTKITALLVEDSVGCGAGVIATALLMGWLFRVLPLRKLYHEVFSYNPTVVRIHRKLGFAEEGVLRRHRYWNGVYQDLHVFACHREGWPAIRDQVVPRRGTNVSSRGVRQRNGDGLFVSTNRLSEKEA